jgi:sugar phosphate permease
VASQRIVAEIHGVEQAQCRRWRWGFWGPGLACIIVAIILYINLADRPQTYGLPSVADYKKPGE